ncbi:MAG: hypothetical protein N3B13_05215 [Deltaproteobacteria bacterium]|nr:hypothetical protein [Deltaproteobacteria bacterium]
MKYCYFFPLFLLVFCSGCSSGDNDAGTDDITDCSFEDISDVVSDTGADILTDISEDVSRCESGIAGIYGPYNKIEISLPAEMFPFPNDYYTRIDAESPTGIRLNYPRDIFLSGIEELTGFPTYPFLVARFVMVSEPEGTFRITPLIPDKYNRMKFAEDSVFLLPLDSLLRDSDINQIEKKLVPLEIHSNDRGTVFAQVREILDEEREYLFFITGRLRVKIEDNSGNLIKNEECIGTVSNFEAIKSKKSVETRYPELEPYRASLSSVFDAIENKLGISRKDIIMFSRFKTGKNISIMNEIKREIEGISDFSIEITDIFKPMDKNGRLTEKMKEYLPCAEDIKSIDEFYDYDFSNVDSIVIGYYDSYNFLNDKNRLNYDHVTRRYVPVSTNRVQFILILPVRDTEKGIISPAPFVLFQHAFEVCKETSMALAGTFSSFGFALGGIDMIGHGIRSGKPRCKDGRLYCDTQSLDFIKVNDMITTVNWLRQSAIDTMAFYKMIKGLKIDVVPSVSGSNGEVIIEESGDGIQDIDAANSLFTSQSLGSYLGISIVSLINDFKASVFNVPAAAFYKLLSLDLSENGEIWELKDMYLPFIISIQTLVDEIEVLNFTKSYFRDAGVNINVLIQAAKNDKVVPHNGTEMLGHFMRLEQADAFVPIPV